MPIYDQSYAHWKGRLEGRIFRWLPITLNGIRLAFRSKLFLILFIVCLVPFVIRGGMIVLYHYIEELQTEPGFSEAVRANGGFYLRFLLENQVLGVIAMCLFAGSPLVARDMKAKALEVYFSKPILIWDYLIGKGMIVAFFVASMTLFPALFLFILDIVFSKKEGYLGETLPLLPGILASSLLIIVTYAFITLACSSLAKTGRVASVAWFAFHVALFVTARIGANVFNEPGLTLFDVRGSLVYLSEHLLGCPLSYDWNPLIPLGFLLALVLLSLAILLKRIRGVEVIRS